MVGAFSNFLNRQRISNMPSVCQLHFKIAVNWLRKNDAAFDIFVVFHVVICDVNFQLVLYLPISKIPIGELNISLR